MTMDRKEPYATQQEFSEHVVRYRDVPVIDLAPVIKFHLVSAEKLSIFFSIMDPNSQVPLHRHPAEQIMLIADGACDLIADGKLYHLEQGDVFIVPSNVEHGVYVSERGCHTIEAFAPPRDDLVAKLEELKKSRQT